MAVGCGVMVVDSYHADAAYLARLTGASEMVVAIDDLARHPFPCDLVVNGGAQAPRLAYRSPLARTRFLLGPQYALLSSEFAAPTARPLAGPIRQVLVTLGGSDAQGLLPRVLATLDGLSGGFAVTAVIGPFVEQSPVERQRPAAHRPLRVVRNPHSLRSLMLASDLAISAGGHTLYELACAGCPAIGIEVADNQAPGLEALEAAGVLRRAGKAQEPGMLGRVGQLVEELGADAEARERMSQEGRRVVDGGGASRVVDASLARQRQATVGMRAQ
jgi:spore coat polysaccharide biosynthesis predicted glycosyltransferase SpsG